MTSEYDKGYQAAIDQVISMLDNTIANKEVMTTLPTEWVLKILRVSLLTPDEEQAIIIYITPNKGITCTYCNGSL